MTDPAMPRPLLLTDSSQAASHLSILGPGSHTFQILDGNKKRNDPKLRKILHGTLEQAYPYLVSWQRQGGAVYVCMNQTDGQGRKNKNIMRVRAYGADTDGAPLANCERLGLLPALVIESSPKRYWLVYPIVDLPRIESDEQRELANKNFNNTQKRLAALLESDPKVTSLSRVMRLAGFENKKDPDAPFMARIVVCYPDIKYTDQEFQTALKTGLENYCITDPIVEQQTKAKKDATGKPTSTSAQAGAKDPPSWSEATEAWVQSMLAVIPGTITREEWLNIGRALHWLNWGECGRLLWINFSSRFPDLFDEAGLNSQWRSFHTEGRASPITVGTLIHLAKQHGWNEPPPPVAVKVHAESQGTSEIEVSTPRFSDDHLALEFVVQYQHEVRYVAQWGQWFRFDGRAWRRDETLAIYDLVRDVCRHLAIGAGRAAKGIASAKTRSAVEQLTRADRRVSATVGQWDANPWLLNTPGGVVDLRTGNILEHRPDFYMTKITAVTPDFTNRKPTLWLKFLRRVMSDDQARVDFLQRLLGYAITGLTREHILAFLHGKGRNGKGVLLTIIRLILLAYHETAPLDAFYASHHDRHPTELAKLAHARVVTATETQEGRYWDEEKIKALTGGDQISARFMGKDFFDFVPKFQLLISGNHKPKLKTVDEAIKARLLLIPFDVIIPKEERDPDLAEKLKPEMPGILAWMIDGCLEYQRIGLAPPAAVRDATAVYLHEADVVARFIDDKCRRDREARTGSTKLYQAFSEWAVDTGERGTSQKVFSERLAGIEGVTKRRRENGEGFDGIALIST